jgi:hypothetical protein
MIIPKKMVEDHERWRRENPEEAARLDAESDRVMAEVLKASEKKFGPQPDGICRIDPKMFAQAVRKASL